MVDCLLDLVRILGVPDVVEVWSIALAAQGELVWEVVLNQILLADILVKMLDSYLVEERWIDEPDLMHLEQLLLASIGDLVRV